MSPAKRRRIEQECQKLSLKFAKFNDARSYAELANLFVMDGIFQRPLTPGNVLRGREEIFLDMSKKPPDIMSHHVMNNLHVDVVSDDTAVGSVYYTVYRQVGVLDCGQAFKFSGTIFVGIYDDRYLRTVEGWCFEQRVARNRFYIEA